MVQQKRNQPGGQQLVQITLHGAAQDAAGERVNHLGNSNNATSPPEPENKTAVPKARCSHQRSGTDGRVEAGHVHVLADSAHHPHEQLQLPAGAGGQEEGADLQGLDGHALRLGLEQTCVHTRATLKLLRESAILIHHVHESV